MRSLLKAKGRMQRSKGVEFLVAYLPEGHTILGLDGVEIFANGHSVTHTLKSKIYTMTLM